MLNTITLARHVVDCNHGADPSQVSMRPAAAAARRPRLERDRAGPGVGRAVCLVSRETLVDGRHIAALQADQRLTYLLT